MIKVTGKVRVVGILKITSFSGWENLIINWDDSPMNWDYWN